MSNDFYIIVSPPKNNLDPESEAAAKKYGLGWLQAAAGEQFKRKMKSFSPAL